MVLGRWLVAVSRIGTVCAVAAVGVACSSSKDSPGRDGGQDGSDVVGCDDPRVQTYAPNLQVAGQGHAFTFVLVSSSPEPPAAENNTWVLHILDSSGNPVTGATGTAVATMPLMSHGTSAVQWAAAADGSYTLTPLYFFMAGMWEVAVTAQSGSQKDSASFYFCVAG